MAIADDLLGVADELRNGATEAHWRRSASSAYYAAFHQIVDDCLVLVLTPDVPPSLYSRSIAHKEMMTCAKAFSVANNLGQTYGFHEAVNAELMLVAENIQQLRSWRISADYATARGFGQQQANDAYVAAEKLQVAARTLRTNSDRGYICMLAGMLLRKPERD